MSNDLLGIGASGLSAYRAALAVVGDNVSNSQTPGYARRTVNITESPVSASSDPLTKSRTIQGGADAASVSRAWDDFKATDARLASADAGAADAKSRWLQTAEAALDDSDTGVASKLTAFFTAGDALAGNPNDATTRSQMLSALGDATSAIGNSAAALARTSAGIGTEAQTDVTSVNDAMGQLTKVNLALHRAGAGTSSAASLMDQRDQLIDSISSNLGVTASFDDAGAATLTLSGTSTVLVGPRGAANLSTQQSADGRLSFAVYTVDGATQAVSPTGGSLAGLADAATSVATRRTQLNGIAADFAATVNGWQAQGIDASGNPGAPLLTISGAADTLKVIATDPGAIAAASTDGTANGNLLTLSALRGGNGVEARFSAIVSGNAQQVASAKAEASATATRRDSAFSARDDVSGVDLNTEAADLLRYQQAYDASAKIIQAAKDTLQTILQIT